MTPYHALKLRMLTSEICKNDGINSSSSGLTPQSK